jgi:uncharacterized protein
MKHKIIFKTIVGSKAYGTNIVSSDDDFKGIYIQDNSEILAFGYTEQFELSKDESYFEIRRFLQLLESANPTVLEMLFMPSECIIQSSPAFELIVKHRDSFITKKYLKAFGGYALAQIKKANSLNKKMNWEIDRMTRKTLNNFCYVVEHEKTLTIEKFLQKHGLVQEYCGLTKLEHIKDCYALYTSKTKGQFSGIFNENLSEVKLSKVQKGAVPYSTLYINKEGYSRHCKDYSEYLEWLNTRNTLRYVDVKNHQQKIDGKNLLHCRRLLDMALKIAKYKTVIVKRPNAEELLKIRRGEVDLETIINEAEKDLLKLESFFKTSDLPEEVDKVWLSELLLEIRNL